MCTEYPRAILAIVETLSTEDAWEQPGLVGLLLWKERARLSLVTAESHLFQRLCFLWAVGVAPEIEAPSNERLHGFVAS